MNKFRVNKPLSDLNNEQTIKMQNFADGANEHKVESKNLSPHAKTNKAFTVPLNEYELSLLRQLARNLERSQRYISRKLLVKALETELNIKHN